MNKDITGLKFGRLTIIKKSISKGNHSMWECLCDCGKIFIVRGDSVTSGHTKSCGCLVGEMAIKTHTRHNMSHSRPYNIWAQMTERCTNKNNIKSFANYIARGITVCGEWKTFEGFWKDMQEGYSDELTIDRINVNKGYSKENCRWATYEQQENNRRVNKFLSYNGETLTMSQWARKLNVNAYLIFQRVKRGKPIEEVLSKTPLSYKYAPKNPKPLSVFK